MDKEPARRKCLYMTTHNIQHSKQTSMSPAAIEPVISSSDPSETLALDPPRLLESAIIEHIRKTGVGQLTTFVSGKDLYKVL